MENQKSKSTFSAILPALILGLIVLWTGPAVAAEKKMVKDPTTGKMVSAPEWGGTLTFVMKIEPPSADPAFGAGSSRGADSVAEKLGIMNWGIDRDEWDFTGFSFPFSVYKGHLAESWETPDPLTSIW